MAILDNPSVLILDPGAMNFIIDRVPHGDQNHAFGLFFQICMEAKKKTFWNLIHKQEQICNQDVYIKSYCLIIWNYNHEK